MEPVTDYFFQNSNCIKICTQFCCCEEDGKKYTDRENVFDYLHNNAMDKLIRCRQMGAIGYISDGDDVQFPSRISAEKSADYVAYNNVPMGATHYKGKIFLTVPRRRVGVPSTLNFVYTKSTKGSNPSFKAFPSEDINRLHVNTQPTFKYLHPI